MRSSNAVTKVLAAMLWCGVSAGCVAEEAKQPIILAEVVAPAKDEIKIEAKYSELRLSLKIESLVIHSNVAEYLTINDQIAIDIKVHDRIPARGHVYWPDKSVFEKSSNWFVGKNVEIFCRVIDKEVITHNQNIKAEQFCTLRGKNEYYVKFN